MRSILSAKNSLILPSLALPLAAPAIIHNADYANTLTAFLPTLYEIIDIVSRELVGMIPSASRNVSADRAAVNQAVTFHKSQSFTASDITPAMQVATPADRQPGSDSVTISKARKVSFAWNGEEQKGLSQGVRYQAIMNSDFAQALRTLTNEMELDGCNEAYLNACRANGTPGTTPFGTNLGDSAQTRKILDDNGAPLQGRSLIVNTATGAALRTLAQLTRVNESGESMTLRDGTLIDLHGFAIKESGQLGAFVKGTAAGATTSAAGVAVGATTIPLAAAGTGTIKAGDVVTFAGDTNKYVVKTGNASVAAGGSIVLQAPGLRQAIPAATTAITVGNSYNANVAISANALQLVTRQPALPEEGDIAIDRMQMIDERSGIVYEIAIYPGYRMVAYEVAVCWGWKAAKPEHIALLQG